MSAPSMNRAAGALLALALSGCAGAPSPQDPAQSPTQDPALSRSMAAPGAAVDPQAAAREISRYRAARGLAPLTVDPALTAMAQRQALAMARAGVLSHEVEGGLSQRFERAGLGARAGVENVSAGYATLEAVVAGWRRSPGHDRNLLDPGARRMGIASAYAADGRYKVFWAFVASN